MTISDSPTVPRFDDEIDDDELDSLPSSDISSQMFDNEYSDAQREWEASLQQLELVLTMVIVPYAGKFLGRKFAFWSWAKFMTWKYPVEVKFTSKTTFEALGAIQAAASL
ncbi:hypothetical protein K3495_g3656 [Podosphaera aphanis]|nr:hypothetical protein K3495_g3656 [Podosphaera aphanis]